MARIIGLTGGSLPGRSTVTSYLKKGILSLMLIRNQSRPAGTRWRTLSKLLVEAFGGVVSLVTGDLNRPAHSSTHLLKPKRLPGQPVQGDHSQSPGAGAGQTGATEDLFFMGIPLLIGRDIWTGLTKSGWSHGGGRAVATFNGKKRLTEFQARDRLAADASR